MRVQRLGYTKTSQRWRDVVDPVSDLTAPVMPLNPVVIRSFFRWKCNTIELQPGDETGHVVTARAAFTTAQQITGFVDLVSIKSMSVNLNSFYTIAW